MQHSCVRQKQLRPQAKCRRINHTIKRIVSLSLITFVASAIGVSITSQFPNRIIGVRIVPIIRLAVCTVRAQVVERQRLRPCTNTHSLGPIGGQLACSVVTVPLVVELNIRTAAILFNEEVVVEGIPVGKGWNWRRLRCGACSKWRRSCRRSRCRLWVCSWWSSRGRSRTLLNCSTAWFAGNCRARSNCCCCARLLSSAIAGVLRVLRAQRVKRIEEIRTRTWALQTRAAAKPDSLTEETASRQTSWLWLPGAESNWTAFP
jgi:hypothetical protein